VERLFNFVENRQLIYYNEGIQRSAIIKMEYVITFISTNYAIKGEKVLLEAGIRVAVMPLPPNIRAGCGICLRVKEADKGPAMRVLADNDVTGAEAYRKAPGSAYEKVDDER